MADISKKTMIMLILIAIGGTLALSTAISILLNRTTNLRVPSLGNIRTVGVATYWDRELENKTERINWGQIWPGKSSNITLYVKSISNVKTTLSLNASNWKPAGLSKYMNLSWNYNGTIVEPGEVIQVRLTLSVSDAIYYYGYILWNEIKDFDFDTIITAR